ncbi:hypothetical protein NEDG_02205 [Nematocida displodere]|uniref:Uncharacterized protein n=1 Tax=Nematocida displodere TaxID=1805483 RepID=A0A177EEM8_9MICR|nr:hypothetical protein NEDG_02205 [Nematocida displodere]
MNITLEGIPDQIVPGIQFTCVRVFGSVSPLAIDVTPPEEVERLVKVLYILSTVSIEKFCIHHFNTNEALPEPPRIPLPTISILCIIYISPPFLEWICKAVDLSGRASPVSITLTECNTTSIKCLDSLGVQNLRSFGLKTLTNLTVLDCQLITKISPNCVGIIGFWQLPMLTKVPEDLATLLAEKRWKKVCMDMRIWNGICSQAKKRMHVAENLWLNLCYLRELEKDIMWTVGTTLCVHENKPNRPPNIFFIESGMKWLPGDADGTKTINSSSNRPIEWDWNTNNEHKRQCLAKMVSESEEWCALFKQRKLYIDNTFPNTFPN